MNAIEEYLLRRGGWVSAAELARLFSVKQRELRTRDDKPGLCSNFAISGNAGFKHVRKATDQEWRHFEARLRAHGIAELARVKRLRIARQDRPQSRFETATGQGLLGLCPSK